MKKQFECKAKYVKTGEDGKETKVSESYMIDADSFTEAEARLYKELETFIQGAFSVKAIKESNVTEIIPSDDENNDRWYKAKVNILEEETGKKTAQYVLVAGKDIFTALQLLNESMTKFIVPYEIFSITDTNIIEVYPYLVHELNK